MKKILKIIFIISLVLLIITLNFKLISLNQSFYQKEFSRLNVYDKIPDADKHALNLINYLKGKEELNSFFNEKEKLHLLDIKNLIQYAFLLFYISLILVILFLIYLIYTKDYKIILNSIFIASLFTLLITLILSLTLINFNNSFTRFHLIFFNNNLWQLNPETDNLINLFSLEFFYDLIKRVIMNTLINSFVLIILTLFVNKLNKRFLNKHI
jgi:integral membrane protein (TIGR01906 family)